MSGAIEGDERITATDYVDPQTQDPRSRGSRALAPKVAMLPGTLSNKANPNCEHQLSLRESIPVQLVSNKFSILHAYARSLRDPAAGR